MYERDYKCGKRDLRIRALVEFGTRFPDTARKTPWFRSAITDLVAVVRASHQERGWSLQKIANLLNCIGVPPSKGKKWHASSLRLSKYRTPSTSFQPLAAQKILKVIYGSKKAQQAWVESIVQASDTNREVARVVWEMHRHFKPYFQKLFRAIDLKFRQYERGIDVNRTTPMKKRRIEFVRSFFGSHQLPFRSLREALNVTRLTSEQKQGSEPLPPGAGLVELLSLDSVESARSGTYLDRPFTHNELVTLMSKKLHTALLEIICGWVKIPVRTVQHHKPRAIQ